MTVHQVLHTFAPGDAISNQAAAIRRVLRRIGFSDSDIFAASTDARWVTSGERPAKPLSQLNLRAKDWIIFHYSIGSPELEGAGLKHLERVVFYYHNITPPEFFVGYNALMARALQSGRDALPRFALAPRVWADSAFDLSELKQIGFAEQGTVIPLIVDVPALLASAQSPAGQAVVQRYADGQTNWLFVGRLVPNKRQDVLIRAFAYYHRMINSRARLLLVGSSAHAPGYALELKSMARAFGLGEAIVFAGAPSLAEGFGGYFQTASVFVCASAHEGFGLPLIEAMAFGLPVVACSTTGVSEAVGNGGMLVSDCQPATIAEAVDLLCGDASLRGKFAPAQLAKIASHTEEALRCSIEPEAIRLGWVK